jgi:heme-degrading monooxygenase HmoA
MPPVVRVWKAYGTPEGVERYCHQHFPEVVLPQLREVDGFLTAQVLVRPLDAEMQVVVATTWASLEAVKAFAGEDYTAAVVEPAVHQLLSRVHDRVSHFTLDTYSPSGEPTRASSVPRSEP